MNDFGFVTTEVGQRLEQRIRDDVFFSSQERAELRGDSNHCPKCASELLFEESCEDDEVVVRTQCGHYELRRPLP